MTIGASSLLPIVEGVSSNIEALLPVVLTIAGILLTVRVVPKIISRFVKF